PAHQPRPASGALVDRASNCLYCPVFGVRPAGYDAVLADVLREVQAEAASMAQEEAAGLPPGVINFVPAPPAQATEAVLGSPHFAGVHFTGSTAVFQGLWRTVGERIATYRSYPRLVGETGGKNFIIAHASADVDA
ncbi:MAG TPA: aldehyde dehydrogenase family protein, partial [Gemmatimonadetes bacterium]|nr:aldehyde dehydrogenase family protein [Gemmatimonadota bacterium]